jgi:hypothetical protein
LQTAAREIALRQNGAISLWHLGHDAFRFRLRRAKRLGNEVAGFVTVRIGRAPRLWRWAMLKYPSVLVRRATSQWGSWNSSLFIFGHCTVNSN